METTRFLIERSGAPADVALALVRRPMGFPDVAIAGSASAEELARAAAQHYFSEHPEQLSVIVEAIHLEPSRTLFPALHLGC